MSRAACFKKSSTGFALAAVLWMLAGLAILVASISRVSLELAERVHQLRERVTFTESAYATRAKMLYWLSATGATTNAYSDGAQAVRVDRTAYRAQEGSIVQMQELGGTLNLNKPNRDLMGRYLEICGIEPARIDSLLDALEDYIDADSLKRFKGAEREDYLAAGLPRGPRNAKLLSVEELWFVFGWQQVKPQLEKAACVTDFTVENSPANVNLATASPKLLLAAGLNEQAVKLLMDGRQLSNEEQAQQMQAAGIGAASPMGGIAGLRASRLLRVTHSEPGQPWRIDYTLRLTAQRDGGPWQIVGPTMAADPHGPAPTPPSLFDWPSQPPAARTNNAANVFSS